VEDFNQVLIVVMEGFVNIYRRHLRCGITNVGRKQGVLRNIIGDPILLTIKDSFMIGLIIQMTKKVNVQLTYEWEFDEKEWREEKKHLDKLKDEPQIVLGYDILSTFYCLNDIVDPDIKDIKVTCV
jgi:hypothetical protein